MRIRSLTTGLLLLLFGLGVGFAGRDLSACGDKFLVMNAGTRYQRAITPRDATILIYNSDTSELPGVFATVSVDKTLRKVGYRPTVVTNAAEFEKEFSRGGWDLIVVGLADAQALRSRVSGDRAPALLPVVFNLRGPQLKQTKTQYHVVVNAPVKSQSFLAAIDEALEFKAKHKEKVRGTSD